MKRLTLEEAVGQTLLARMQIGEHTLLRFTDGFVTLYTHFESYDIYDFTDGEDPLAGISRFDDGTLDALHVNGFIDGHEKFEAATKRATDQAAWETRREADLRAHYETLKERFEPAAAEPPMSPEQVTAVRCAHADLQGALQCHQQMDVEAHDWKAHAESVAELEAAFSFLS